ncbi:MAG: hypothetical protein QW734_09500 [Candidatus Bathyarchaeia archaeon]
MGKWKNGKVVIYTDADGKVHYTAITDGEEPEKTMQRLTESGCRWIVIFKAKVYVG